MKELEEFKTWLTTLGYSTQRTKQYPRAVERMLLYFEKDDFKLLSIQNILSYFEQLKQKAHAPSYINTQITAWRTFSKFYFHYYRFNLPTATLNYLKVNQVPKAVLSREEIKALYGVMTTSKYGYRDRVLLGLCYGCGLRRAEAIGLLVTDIDLEDRLVHIRNTKNNHERLVPIPKLVIQDIKNYLKQGRPLLQKHQKYQRELFIGYRGKPITAQVYEKRIKVLIEQTGLVDLISKQPTLHSLRHSIATHLLEAGMPLEQVSRFLGHHTLTATQVYTHIQKHSP
jgi:integrase/recombinase XerD